MEEALLDKLARVLVETGVNLQKGQYLLLQTSTDSLDLARKITEHAFRLGAKDVEVIIEDPEIKKIRGLYGDKDTLAIMPEAKKNYLDYYLNQDCCQMGIMSSRPSGMEGVSTENALAIAKADNDLRNVIRKHIHAGTLQWTGTVYANVDWAKKVFSEYPEDVALTKLEEALGKMMRLDDDDPVKAWDKHCEEMSKVSAKLNEYDFASLHIETELGTDITLPLVDGHIWTSAADMGESLTRVPYVANMPTEEVFTDPHRDLANGIAYATYPLMMSGKLVKDFWIRFENGLAIECGASENLECLQAALFKDDNTRRLGEVALVSKRSPITMMNRIFYNGLIDENAASHLAFGQSFSSNIRNGTRMSEEELVAHGVNVASCHNDFMIGTPKMKVTGIRKDGTVIKVMEEGDFVL